MSISRYFSRLIFTLLMLITLPAAAQTVDKIIVFGDSLSDNGNFYSFTLHFVPGNPPYYKGRFSNGPTWVENLAAKMHLNPETNYAYGGATAHADRNDLAYQVNKYLWYSAQDKNKDKHLYVLWIGSNDYLDGRGKPEEETDKTIASIQKHLDLLIEAGAKNFLILNLPDLGRTPLAHLVGAEYAAKISKTVRMHNQKLTALLAKEKKQNSAINVIFFDVTAYFSDAIDHPNKFGISDSTNACFEGDTYMFNVLTAPRFEAYKAKVSNTGVLMHCGNADEHLFWDHVHPTRVVHQRIAQAVFEKLKKNAI